MNKEKSSFYKKRLIREKNKIEGLLENIENPGGEGFANEYSTELSSYDNHPGDLGTEMFIMEQDKGMINKLKYTLDEIDDSIEDLKLGRYGICANCDKKINEGRLDLIPYLKLCAGCAQEVNPRDENRKFRPLEEEVFNSLRQGIREGIQFDREDAYQAVARYNRVDQDPSHSTGDHIGIYDDEERGIVEEIEKFSTENHKEIPEE